MSHPHLYTKRGKMKKYLFSRVVRGIISIIVIVFIIMRLVYSLSDKDLIFMGDPVFNKALNNKKTVYKYEQWEKYGYLDYMTYADYLNMLRDSGRLDKDTFEQVVSIGATPDKDSEATAAYVKQFYDYCKEEGYSVIRLDRVVVKATFGDKVSTAEGGEQKLFAYKNTSVFVRLGKFLSNLIHVDKISYAEGDVGERGISFTWYDPAYGGEKFSPAIIGNGTQHKYLLYFDNKFPFIHQNIVKIQLGKSYSVRQGIDVFDTMVDTQGTYVKSTITYPSGLVEESANDLHKATYIKDSQSKGTNSARFTDDYTNTPTVKNGKSKMGYSFVIGIFSVIGAYCLGVPLGILMARKKDKLFDKLGTIYIIFIMAVPSLAYIFMFKAVGAQMGLPTTFDVDSPSKLIYILPIISLALPSIANLMKWIRRYMIDQMNSDYVKFARSGGLSEGEIFGKHIMKNAIIPIVHGIPGSVLGAMTGALITERVYTVPGAGGLLVEALNKYDNSVIVGVAMFYAILSVVSVILGDIFMSMVDPRISFSTKER